MHIGIDLRLAHYRPGGIARYAEALVGALAETDFDGRFTVFQAAGDPAPRTPADPRFERAALQTPSHHRFERWLLARELGPHGLDVFHSPDFIPPASGAVRRIVTMHDLHFLDAPESFPAEARRYYAGQIEWAAAEADAILSDSEHTRRRLIDRFGLGDKVVAVRLAAAPGFEFPAPSGSIDQALSRLGLAPGYALFVGSLEPRKNLPMLLAAWAAARERHGVAVPLVLAGRPGAASTAVFEARARLGLEQAVTWVEGPSDENLRALYAAAAVLVLPSLDEGFGLPVLEAMHQGCPVVASAAGALPEVVGDAGLLLDPTAPEAWTAALADLLASPERRSEWARRGRARAAQFNWRRAALETLAVYAGG